MTTTDDKGQGQEDPVAEEIADADAGPSTGTEAETGSGGRGKLPPIPAAAEAETSPIPEPATAEPVRRSGFAGALFGGIVAVLLMAGLGYLANRQGLIAITPDNSAAEAAVAAATAERAELTRQLAEQADLIASLQAELGTVAASIPGPDGRIPEVIASVAGLNDEIAALADRLTGIELQPIPKADLPEEVVAAYEARLADMQAGLETQLNEMRADVTAELDRLAAISASVGELEADAVAAANNAAASAALSRVRTALDSGTPFAEPLAEYAERTVQDIPAPLEAAMATGIPTLRALQEGFPEVARAALQVAPGTEAGGGWAGFLKTQLGARSLEEREGGDPDAVLSRAEARLGEGDLQAVQDELALLPEAGQQEMAAWLSELKNRQAAVDAVAALVAAMPQN